MTRQIGSELLKLRTTRTTLGLALGMLVLVAFGVVVLLLSPRFDTSGFSLADEDDQRAIFATGSTAGLFALLVGVLSVTSELRHGTIRPTLLFTPSRERVVVAKGAASALAGAALAILSVGLTFVVAVTWLRLDEIDRLLGRGDLAGIAAGTIGAAAFWAVAGAGVGAVVRNQVGAIIGTIVWSMIPEPILQALAPGVGRFTPGAAGDAASGATGEQLLSPLGGLAVLGLWAAALLVAGAVVTARRDVP